MMALTQCLGNDDDDVSMMSMSLLPEMLVKIIFSSKYLQSVVSVRVMALNTWGMPAKVGSEDKELRMKVIITVMILFCGEGARVWLGFGIC